MVGYLVFDLLQKRELEPPTCSQIFSKLKTMIMRTHKIDIGSYATLQAVLANLRSNWLSRKATPCRLGDMIRLWEQLKRGISNPRLVHTGAIATVAFAGGMRPGEVAQLRWCDVELEAETPDGTDAVKVNAVRTKTGIKANSFYVAGEQLQCDILLMPHAGQGKNWLRLYARMCAEANQGALPPEAPFLCHVKGAGDGAAWMLAEQLQKNEVNQAAQFLGKRIFNWTSEKLANCTGYIFRSGALNEFLHSARPNELEVR
jgi:hypothetical protein